MIPCIRTLHSVLASRYCTSAETVTVFTPVSADPLLFTKTMSAI
jgi:hypothetical protein